MRQLKEEEIRLPDQIPQLRYTSPFSCFSSIDPTRFESPSPIVNFPRPEGPLEKKVSGEIFSYDFLKKEFEEELHTYYFGARFYDPEIGVWLTPDPKEQELNLYSYVGGDPVNRIDPFGLEWVRNRGGVWPRDPDWVWKSDKTKTYNYQAQRQVQSHQEMPVINFTTENYERTQDIHHQATQSQQRTELENMGDVELAFKIAMEIIQSIPDVGNLTYQELSELIDKALAGKYKDTSSGKKTLIAALVLAQVYSGSKGKTVNKSKKVLEKVKALPTPRQSLLNNVKNAKLKNLINQMYRKNAEVGSGSTADAIRHEIKTGELLSPKGHTIKGQEMRAALNKLVHSGDLDAADKKIAIDLMRDLQKSLSGY